MKIRLCNDYCVENPLQVFEYDRGFFGYDVLEGVEEYLNFKIPENIKDRILNQEEEWERCYDNTPPEDPDVEEVKRVRDLAISILKDLRNILPEEVEVYLWDEILRDEVLIK